MARTKYRTLKPYLGRRKKRRSVVNKNRPSEVLVTPAASGSQEVSCANTRKMSTTLENIEEDEARTEMIQNELNDSFFLVQLSSLGGLLNKVLCPLCKLPGLELELQQGKSKGFAMKFAMSCENCSELIDENYLCQRVGGTQSTKVPFEINSRAAQAFKEIGCGFSSMKKWCGVMNMPCSMTRDTHTRHLKSHSAISK